MQKKKTVAKTEEKAYEVSSRSSAAVSLRRSGYPAPGASGLLGGEINIGPVSSARP